MSRSDEAKRKITPVQVPERRIIDPGELVARQHGLERSPEWPRVEKEHLAKEPWCVCCGEKAREGQGRQVHHIFPFNACHLLGRPDLELDPRNLITLCQSEHGRPEEDHHLLVGHLDNFESANLEVRRDAERVFRGMSGAEIRENPRWKELVRGRMKAIREMSEGEKRALVEIIDRRFPRR